MGCDLFELLLLIRGQIRFDVLDVASDQENSGRNTIGPDQLCSLSLELRQLQDRDLWRIVHYWRVYRSAV